MPNYLTATLAPAGLLVRLFSAVCRIRRAYVPRRREHPGQQRSDFETANLRNRQHSAGPYDLGWLSERLGVYAAAGTATTPASRTGPRILWVELWVDNLGLGWQLTVRRLRYLLCATFALLCQACSQLSGLTEHEQSVMQSVTSASIYGFSVRLACEAVGTA